MKLITTILFLFLVHYISFGQLKKTIHQTFELESINQIEFELVGEYEIETWAGNNILTETKVELYDANPSIFRYFVEKKERYNLNGEKSEKKLIVRAVDSVRRQIKYKEIECYEVVKLKIFVPDNFKVQDDHVLIRNY